MEIQSYIIIIFLQEEYFVELIFANGVLNRSVYRIHIFWIPYRSVVSPQSSKHRVVNFAYI